MISISVSLIGFFIIKFEIEEVFQDFGLKKVFLNPLVILLALSLLMILNFYFFKPIYVWISSLILYLIIYFLPLLIKQKFEQEIKDETIPFLDDVILNTNSGKTLRCSMVKASDGFKGWKNTQFKLLINSVFLGQQSEVFHSKTLKNLHSELLKIESSKVKTSEQLKSYRQHLKMEQNLRHRSRQVMLNLKIQSFVMTFLYILIGFFIFSNFDTSSSHSVMFFSIFIFSLGQVLVFFIGKRLKWKT